MVIIVLLIDRICVKKNVLIDGQNTRQEKKLAANLPSYCTNTPFARKFLVRKLARDFSVLKMFITLTANDEANDMLSMNLALH